MMKMKKNLSKNFFGLSLCKLKKILIIIPYLEPLNIIESNWIEKPNWT